jgi:hypothetical protein
MTKHKDIEALNSAVDRILQGEVGSPPRRRETEDPETPHSGRRILKALSTIPELSWEDAQSMLTTVTEDWESGADNPYDLR